LPGEERSDEEIAVYCSDCLRDTSRLSVLTVGYHPLMFLVFESHANKSNGRKEWATSGVTNQIKDRDDVNAYVTCIPTTFGMLHA
jgi:hypothetical protein